MIPWDAAEEGALVWNFEFGHWDLFEVWFFSAWDFNNFHLAVIFRKTGQLVI
jgi:hypothetical protein